MCQDCNYERWEMQIEMMLNSGDFDWAKDTLEGIYNYICENCHITDRQVNAIENIRLKG